MKHKVLYVQHSGFMGGAPRSLGMLVERIDKKKYEPHILVLGHGPSVEYLEKTGATVSVNTVMRPFHGSTVTGMTIKLFIRNILHARSTQEEAKKILREIKPDILHLNSTCLFMIARAAKIVSPNTKIVVHVREPLLDSFAGKILRSMNHKYADAFVCIDNYDASKIDASNRISQVIYNFIAFPEENAEHQKNKLRLELGLSEDSTILLYLARIAPSNGALELVKLITPYLESHPKTHLIMVGMLESGLGRYGEQVQEKCKAVKNIHLLPFRDDVEDILKSSDIHICPFVKPHFSRSIIEAAALGIPSLATDIDGPRELIQNQITGLLYSPGNSESFNTALSRLVEDNAFRENMGKKAKEFARKNFDAQVNSLKTFAVYDQLLGEPANSSLV